VSQQQQVGTDVVLGSSGQCQMVLGRVLAPSGLAFFQDAAKSDPGSSITFNTQESATRLDLFGSTDADDRWGFDYVEYNYALAMQAYDIPAPSCDSLITYWIKHTVNLFAGTLTATYGWIRAMPVLYVSPDGSTPSLSQFLAHVRYDLMRVASIDDDEKDYGYGNPPIAYERSHSYTARAGARSRIFAGLLLDIWAIDGWVTGSAASMVLNPAISSYFPDNPPGVQYLSWPESMFPNCYITTAVCAALGKGDDCRELRVLRAYRDGYLRARPDGKQLIDRYYANAPALMSFLLLREDAADLFATLYERYIEPCVRLIEEGRNEPALELYRRMLVFVESTAGITAS
jgi:hypothetical protein